MNASFPDRGIAALDRVRPIGRIRTRLGSPGRQIVGSNARRLQMWCADIIAVGGMANRISRTA
jgi:hypothetical protein